MSAVITEDLMILVRHCGDISNCLLRLQKMFPEHPDNEEMREEIKSALRGTKNMETKIMSDMIPYFKGFVAGLKEMLNE